MYPRKPQGKPAAQRGGFFRALNFYRQTDVLTSDFDGTIATTRSTPTPLGDELGHSQDQQAKDSLGANYFLDKLNLPLLERLWVAIKKNCMLNTAAARGQIEAISEKDFLELAFKQVKNHTEDDECFLIKLFRCVDRRKKGSVRTTDIATALVLICNEGPIPKQKDGLSKLKTLFRIFDADDDSCLTHDEIFDMYLSIKVNDVTKTRQALITDIVFDDELSLQEAKRLYELTIELLNVVSDFVIFEEFKKVFDERPSLITDLLPGSFTLEWILSDYRAPGIETNSFGADVRDGLKYAMRRGEEHLLLSNKRGRGMRIMQNCLNLASHRVVEDDEQSHITDTDAADAKLSPSAASGPGTSPDAAARARAAAARASRASLPKITSATKSPRSARRGSNSKVPAMNSAHEAKGGATTEQQKADDDDADADDDDESDEEDATDEYGHGGGREARVHVPTGQPTQNAASVSTGPQHGHTVAASSAKASLPIEALDLPQLELLPLNHTHSMRFRAMTLDAKTQQAYLRDKKDVNRAQKYQCLVCAVNHDFRLSKLTASVEHQHV
jgi:hypothetical protein